MCDYSWDILYHPTSVYPLLPMFALRTRVVHCWIRPSARLIARARTLLISQRLIDWSSVPPDEGGGISALLSEDVISCSDYVILFLFLWIYGVRLAGAFCFLGVDAAAHGIAGLGIWS